MRSGSRAPAGHATLPKVAHYVHLDTALEGRVISHGISIHRIGRQYSYDYHRQWVEETIAVLMLWMVLLNKHQTVVVSIDNLVFSMRYYGGVVGACVVSLRWSLEPMGLLLHFVLW